MMSLLQQLENSGLSTWVRQSGSLWAFPGILLAHTYGMRLMPALPMAPLQKFLPLVWLAFWVNAITGTVLLAADASTKLTNPDFGIKMVFIVLAVISQRMIQTRVFGAPDLDGKPFSTKARMLAVMSLVCWLGAITAGRLLAYVGPTSGL